MHNIEKGNQGWSNIKIQQSVAKDEATKDVVTQGRATKDMVIHTAKGKMWGLS